ncbi:MAG: hypothetical protein SGBAC_011619 [Bacillariaceae sp.]
MQFYIQEPFLFNGDPQQMTKEEAYRPRPRGSRRNSGSYYSVLRTSNNHDNKSADYNTMGFWDPELLEEMMDDNRYRQKRLRSQHRDRDRDRDNHNDRISGNQTPFGGRHGGFDFLVFPPGGLHNRRRRSSSGKGGIRDCQKPCQALSPVPVPVPVPTTSTTTAAATNPFNIAKQHNKSAVKPSAPPLELLIGSEAPSSQIRRQRQSKQEYKAADPSFVQPFFSTTPSRRYRQQQQLKQKQKQFTEAPTLLQTRLEKQQRARNERNSNNETREEGPNDESSNSSSSSSSNNFDNCNPVFQLPQQWYVQETDRALILSIDVAGFQMEELNLQIDPIHSHNQYGLGCSSGSSTAATTAPATLSAAPAAMMQLTFKAQRTNSLGQVWGLERTTTLNPNVYKVNAVDASCDDSVLQITIPKKLVMPTLVNIINVPIRAATTAATTAAAAAADTSAPTRELEQEKVEDEKTQQEEAKTQDEESSPVTLQDLIDAMADIETTTPTDSDTQQQQKAKSFALQNLLDAMADDFARVFQPTTDAQQMATSFTLRKLLDAMTENYARTQETAPSVTLTTPQPGNEVRTEDETHSNNQSEEETSSTAPLSVDQVLEAWAAGFLQAYEPADLKPSDATATTTTVTPATTTTTSPATTATEAKEVSFGTGVDAKKDAQDEVSTLVTSNTTATSTTSSSATVASLQLSPTFDADDVASTSESNEQKVKEETEDYTVVAETEAAIKPVEADGELDHTCHGEEGEAIHEDSKNNNSKDAPTAAVNAKEYLAGMENDLQNDLQKDSFNVVASKEKEDDHQSWEDLSAHE